MTAVAYRDDTLDIHSRNLLREDRVLDGGRNLEHRMDLILRGARYDFHVKVGNCSIRGQIKHHSHSIGTKAFDEKIHIINLYKLVK